MRWPAIDTYLILFQDGLQKRIEFSGIEKQKKTYRCKDWVIAVENMDKGKN